MRPWLCGIEINGIPYAIPCTTQDTGIGYAGFVRCIVPDRGLQLRYMVPLPPEALLPAKPLPESLAQELKYFEEIKNYIVAEAKMIHDLSTKQQMGAIFESHCCDFAALEAAYTQWKPDRNVGQFLYPKEENKMGKYGSSRVSPEQIELARSKSALEYAQSQGYELVRQNGWYKMREHDSMVFSPDGRWFWNSRNVSGKALDFMIYYENRPFVEAVQTLTGMQRTYAPAARPAAQEQTVTPKQPSAAFKLPERAPNFRYLFDYLCGKRALEREVVLEMIRQNRLFQSKVTLPNGKTVYNATFVYLNDKGNPVGAYQRGMLDTQGRAPYKRDVFGSDKRYGWKLAAPFNPATQVRVFEAAIDAASDASLCAMKDGARWREAPIDRLSLEGVQYPPLQNYLRANPDVRQVTLMLDADAAGLEAAKRIAACVRRDFPQVTVETLTPLIGKDWNETLTQSRGMIEELQESQTPQPDAPAPEMD